MTLFGDNLSLFGEKISLLGDHYHFRWASTLCLIHRKNLDICQNPPLPPFWHCQYLNGAYSENPSLICKVHSHKKTQHLTISTVLVLHSTTNHLYFSNGLVCFLGNFSGTREGSLYDTMGEREIFEEETSIFCCLNISSKMSQIWQIYLCKKMES